MWAPFENPEWIAAVLGPLAAILVAYIGAKAAKPKPKPAAVPPANVTFGEDPARVAAALEALVRETKALRETLETAVRDINELKDWLIAKGR